MSREIAKLDQRDVRQLVSALLSRRLGYVPEWVPKSDGLDGALIQSAATFWQAIIERLNQAPDKNELAFFETLGIQLIPSQAARTPLVFRLADNAPDARLPAGARVAAPPPPESNNQIIFETERATGLAAARLKEVFSLWPGRDQYIDHSDELLAGLPFQPFRKKLLENTPHHLYLAHNTLLALAGVSRVEVIFELTVPSSKPLDLIWEYSDGKSWREFNNMRPACDEEEALKLDSTGGLRTSGRFVLQTDCAESSKTDVNGIEAFWIRGRLDETLPPSERVLPEVESIQLRAGIDRQVQIELTHTDEGIRRMRISDNSGAPLKGVKVNETWISDADGIVPATADNRFQVTAGDFQEVTVLSTETLVDLKLSGNGLPLDKAFANAEAVDVTKPFYPLGLQPQPGSVFYFSSEEVFSKPGAQLQVYIQTATSPQDQLITSADDPPPPDGEIFVKAGPTHLAHTVSWEYWNGTDWIQQDRYTFSDNTNVSPKDFSGVGLISSLLVPFDMAKTKVNGTEALWMRVRLLSGGYGFRDSVVDARTQKKHVFIVTQPPSVAKFVLGYIWQHGPFHPEQVLPYNDFQYEDKTEAARLPGETFLPYKPVSDRTPALYLGFDKKLPVDRLGILFSIEEDLDETLGPALLWQYFDGILWQDLIADDETRNLRLPGLISLIGPEDSEALARFDVPLHWLRARLKEDGPPGEPVIKGLFPNAVHAIQHQTIVDEAMGASTGQPSQTFAFVQIPVLGGEIIEVREVAGLRANVEWRSVAQELFARDESAIRELEAMLGRESQTEIRKGDLRLTRDRNKRVTEVWVRWFSRRHLRFSGPNDRDYVVDRAQGLLLFGDARNGKVPPAGALIQARQYQTGGGAAGNVKEGKISQILAPAGGIEQVFNPLPAEGGADSETLSQYQLRAPQTLRHRGRALLPGDYEAFAREASPSVSFARAIPGRNPSGQITPGWVTLLIIPESDLPRPFPSFGLREEVRLHIEANTAADIAAAHRIHVTGPKYFPIDVDLALVPVDPAEAGFVEQRTREALQTFFHPLRGGPDGRGWDLGRDVFISDVAAVVERVAGVDYVKDLRLLINSELQGERVNVGDDYVVVAGQFRISLVGA